MTRLCFRPTSLAFLSFCSMLILISGHAFAAGELTQTFTLDGQLLQAGTTNPLLDAAAKINVLILDPSKTCLLYEEQQTVNTTSSNGYFNIQVGSLTSDGKRTVNDPGRTMIQIYQNNSAITANNAPSATCVGSSYTPTANDSRYIRIIVTPSATNTPDTIIPDATLDAVPTALVAQTVQGYTPSNFLQTVSALEGTPGTTQSRMTRIVDTDYSVLDALLNGTSNQYMTTSNSAPTKLPVLASTPGAPTAGQIWYEAGSLRYYDGVGAQIRTVGTSGGSVTSVATGTGLTGGPITSTGTISLASGVATPGTYQSVTVDTYGRVTAGTSPTTLSGYGITNAVVNGGQTGAVTVGTSDATNLTFNTNNTAKMTILSGGNVGIGTANPGTKLDVNGDARATNYILPIPGGASGQPAGGIYNDAASTNGMILTAAGGIRMPDPIYLGTTYNGGTGTLSGNAAGDIIFGSNGNARALIDNSGNLGIGTSTPSALLNVVGGSGTKTIISHDAGVVPTSTAALNVWGNAFGTSKIASFSYSDSAGGNRGGFDFNDIGGAGDWGVPQLHLRSVGGPSPVEPEILSTIDTDNAANTGLKFRVGTSAGAALSSSTAYSFFNNTTELAHISSNGNVGIGTTTPVSLVHAASDAAAQLTMESRVDDPANHASFQAKAVGAQLTMQAHPTSKTAARFGLTLGGWTELRSQDNSGTNSGLVLGTVGSAPVVFGTTNLERMRINSSGNVGIGTTSPQAKLDINGFMRMSTNAAAPAACTAAINGSIALTSLFTTCACKGATTTWVSTVDGTTACVWM